MQPSYWLIDYLSKYEIHLIAVKETIYRKNTSLQQVEIVDTYEFGKCLILDGKIQSAETDEFIYHEALVQPSFAFNKEAKDILIIGGGEGATLREVLKHKKVEKIVMVDIDEEVVNICKKYLKKWHKGAFDNKKVKLIFADARKYLETTNKQFDIIIIDLSDPKEESSPSYLLFTKEFYQIVEKHLKSGGIMVTQTGIFTHMLNSLFVKSYTTLKKVFKHVLPYHVVVPSFGGDWSFNLATNYEIEEPAFFEDIPLKFYNTKMHSSMFYLPNYITETLNQAKVIISDNDLSALKEAR